MSVHWRSPHFSALIVVNLRCAFCFIEARLYSNLQHMELVEMHSSSRGHTTAFPLKPCENQSRDSRDFSSGGQESCPLMSAKAFLFSHTAHPGPTHSKHIVLSSVYGCLWLRPHDVISTRRCFKQFCQYKHYLQVPVVPMQHFSALGYFFNSSQVLSKEKMKMRTCT